jgi:hypothetical protein
MRRIAWLPGALALLVLAAYAALLPAGKWQGDEYIGAWLFRQFGWHAVLDRLRGWSPRPLAETLGWLYFSASNVADRPLIWPFLGLLWLAGFLGIAWAARVARLDRPFGLAAIWFALVLLLARPGEMFYWPMGAASYLPCWAALAAATALHLGRRSEMALAICLCVAATSAEIGALVVLLYAGLAALAGEEPALLRRWRVLAVPALVAAVVCLAVLRGRMSAMPEVIDPASGLAGNWLGSLRAAAPVFAAETAGVDSLPLPLGAAVKVLLLLCLPSGLLPPGQRRRTVLWGVALLAAAFASVVLAFHQFGALCCGRHAALRQGLVLLGLASFAALLGGAFQAPRRLGLAAVLLGLLALRATLLWQEFRLMPEVIATRQRNWDQGNGPGDAMTLRLAPAGGITNNDALPEGRYLRDSEWPFGNTPWFAWGIMARFGKHTLTIAPSQPSS